MRILTDFPPAFASLSQRPSTNSSIGTGRSGFPEVQIPRWTPCIAPHRVSRRHRLRSRSRAHAGGVRGDRSLRSVSIVRSASIRRRNLMLARMNAPTPDPAGQSDTSAPTLSSAVPSRCSRQPPCRRCRAARTIRHRVRDMTTRTRPLVPVLLRASSQGVSSNPRCRRGRVSPVRVRSPCEGHRPGP